MFHNQKPPDPENAMFLVAVVAPLMLGLSMAQSGAPTVSCVMATWLTTHVLMILLATNSRKR